jgi:hypothetical protein
VALIRPYQLLAADSAHSELGVPPKGS